MPGCEDPGSESTAAARIDAVPPLVNLRRISSVTCKADFSVVSRMIDLGGEGRSVGSSNLDYSLRSFISKFVPRFDIRYF